MSKFEREDRYAVIKYKKLTDQQWTLAPTLLEKFNGARVDCVVVEKDWPEYDFVWLMLEHRMAGYSVPDFNAVKCAADVAVAQAELETAQATIARLTAENEQIREAYKSYSSKLVVDALNAEIERLKGGQREPVAYGMASELARIQKRPSQGHMVYGSANGAYDVALFTSQPAPISVPEGWKLVPIEPTEAMALAALKYSLAHPGQINGVNTYRVMVEIAPACLDKVKELNQ